MYNKATISMVFCKTLSTIYIVEAAGTRRDLSLAGVYTKLTDRICLSRLNSSVRCRRATSLYIFLLSNDGWMETLRLKRDNVVGEIVLFIGRHVP